MNIPDHCAIQFPQTAYPSSGIAGSIKAKRSRLKGVNSPAKVMSLSAGVAIVRGFISRADTQKLSKVLVPRSFGGAMQLAPARPMRPFHTCLHGYWLQANHGVEIAVDYGDSFSPYGRTQENSASLAKTKSTHGIDVHQ